MTISVPGLEGNIEISGISENDNDGDSNSRRVSISIPGLSGLFGSGSGLGSLFGVEEDTDNSGVSLSFNFGSNGGGFGDIFRQTSSIFQSNNPFGLNGFYLDDGPETSFSNFNSFFSSGPDVVIVRRPVLPASPALGQFSVLQGGPWDSFRNIFRYL